MMEAMYDDTTPPWSTCPGWERHCFWVSMVGWAVMLLALAVQLFASHGNGWWVAFFVGTALLFGGIGAAAVLQRRHRRS